MATTAPSSRSRHSSSAAAVRVVPSSRGQRRACAGRAACRRRRCPAGSRARVTPEATICASQRIGAPASQRRRGPRATTPGEQATSRDQVDHARRRGSSGPRPGRRRRAAGRGRPRRGWWRTTAGRSRRRPSRTRTCGCAGLRRTRCRRGRAPCGGEATSPPAAAAPAAVRPQTEQGAVDDDLGAVGAPGAPSAVGLSFDPEAVVDLGVVPFAEQRGVLQEVSPSSSQCEEVVDVAPVGGGVAAGEDAVPVADLDRPAQVRRDEPLGAAQVQRLPVGADDDAGDVAVAGQPAGPGGGDDARRTRCGRRPAPVAGSTRSSRSMVTTTCGLTRAQDRQVARGEGVVGQLDEGVGRLLGAGARCPRRGGRPARSTRARPAPSPRRPRRGRRGRTRCRRCAWRSTATAARWGRVRRRRGPAGPGSGRRPGRSSACGRVAATSASAASIAATSTPCAAARARFSAEATGAITLTASAVTAPGGARAASGGQLLQGPAVAHEPPGLARRQPVVPAQPGRPSWPCRRARTPGSARPRAPCAPARRRAGSARPPATPVRSITAGPNDHVRSSTGQRLQRTREARRRSRTGGRTHVRSLPLGRDRGPARIPRSEVCPQLCGLPRHGTRRWSECGSPADEFCVRRWSTRRPPREGVP